MPKAVPTSIESNERFDIIVLEPGIVEVIIKESVHVEATDVRRIKEINRSFMKDARYCVLVTSHFLSAISREARELSASAEFNKETIAKALMTNSTGHRLVGNFYLTVNKPHIKTKLFSERLKAIDWLRKQSEAD